MTSASANNRTNVGEATSIEYGSSILGYPRIGARRELKRALESYWHREIDQEELLTTGRQLQEDSWSELAATGLEQVPGNTFSYYDHVLDNALLFGAVPTRFKPLAQELNPVDFYFTMARGRPDFPPLELVRFFGTNYHYRQPELDPETSFALNAQDLLDEHSRAKAKGIELRPVVLGPVSLLMLSKAAPGAPADFSTLSLIDVLLPYYIELLEKLAKAGAKCIQLDEPAFTGDRSESELAVFEKAYGLLGNAPLRPRILVTGQYGKFGKALNILASSNVEAIGLDLVTEGRIDPAELAQIPGIKRKRLYAGVVNGRNIWKVNRLETLAYLEELKKVVPDIVVSTSTTLLHVPYDVNAEYDIPGEVADRLAFAKQKVGEIIALAKALRNGAPERWNKDARIENHPNATVLKRVSEVTEADRVRVPYEQRKKIQQEKLQLPLVPATTLGSFPQTPAIRQARYELGQGRMEWADYYRRIQEEIERIIRLQEDIGLDVLVHGEVERNDMIQYFAELLEGFAFTHNGWVQAYGSRAVRPPILYGDVARPKAMTVEWISFAQSLTNKPVKGILTGPVTMLARSFVRDDQSFQAIADQLALVVRDEIADLEAAGIGIIQVDEPAIRELLPLREEGRQEYLAWAVNAFRLATAGAKPETQIHTHLGYSSLSLVVDAFDKLDADVTAIVATRSITWVLSELKKGGLSREVGPGVYESRSARIPDIDELDALLTEAAESIDIDRLWANPDGGLKTRYYWQLQPSLRNMVAAAHRLRRRAKES
ncbi:MAG: 5-methyltetrahydropteroyltriglutamate--homocysteine S-methyltransferase [Mycobacteriaceae bacterium]